MNLVAIDTSTLTASAAVLVDGRVAAAANAASGTHSEVLMPLVARLCDEAKIAPRAIGAVAVGAGPGSFTGLRIGLATAKGIAFAAGAPLWMVSSLAALAHAARATAGIVIPVMDARRGEVYARMPSGEEIVLAPDKLALPEDATVIGDYQLGARWIQATPSAVDVGQLAMSGDRTDALAHGAPTYVRIGFS